MHCSNCGVKLSGQPNFCYACGNKLQNPDILKENDTSFIEKNFSDNSSRSDRKISKIYLVSYAGSILILLFCYLLQYEASKALSTAVTQAGVIAGTLGSMLGRAVFTGIIYFMVIKTFKLKLKILTFFLLYLAMTWSAIGFYFLSILQ